MTKFTTINEPYEKDGEEINAVIEVNGINYECGTYEKEGDIVTKVEGLICLYVAPDGKACNRSVWDVEAAFRHTNTHSAASKI